MKSGEMRMIVSNPAGVEYLPFSPPFNPFRVAKTPA